MAVAFVLITLSLIDLTLRHPASIWVTEARLIGATGSITGIRTATPATTGIVVLGVDILLTTGIGTVILMDETAVIGGTDVARPQGIGTLPPPLDGGAVTVGVRLVAAGVARQNMAQVRPTILHTMECPRRPTEGGDPMKRIEA